MSEQATTFLRAAAAGDAHAAEQLVPLVYAELRALAGSYFRGRAVHTLQPTALVHEAFVRLIGSENVAWRDRAHFMALAATVMRQILTDHARRRSADKRGGDWQRVGLERVGSDPEDQDELDVLMLDDLLAELASLDARKHRIVELRFFGGLSMDEVAEVLEISKTTVETDWRATRAWLNQRLSRP